MISIGILSYWAPKTLEYTLNTYKNGGLFDITDDIFVVLQYSDRQEEEVEVCKKFNIRYIKSETNGRMASGFKKIYENANPKYKYILILENDFTIRISKEKLLNFFINAFYFLENNLADVVRGRNRNNIINNCGYQYLRDIPPEKFENHTHLSECIFWVNNPEILYSSNIKKINGRTIVDDLDEEWYITTAKNCNYTNQPCIYSKEFFKSEILPHLLHNENIEDRLTDLWATKDYKCVFGFGIFDHDRCLDGHF